VFLVYLVMAATFESFLHPFIVLFTIPLALVGVVAALLADRHHRDRHRAHRRRSCWWASW
jgi:multidrug efflux pump subunit AcrB